MQVLNDGGDDGDVRFFIRNSGSQNHVVIKFFTCRFPEIVQVLSSGDFVPRSSFGISRMKTTLGISKRLLCNLIMFPVCIDENLEINSNTLTELTFEFEMFH